MAIGADDVKKLAELSRIELSDAEVAKLQSEIDSILSYVDTIRKVELPAGVTSSPHLALENVMRDDANPHEAGIHTDALLTQAPRRDGGFLKVRKILP
ncbi:MAG: Asp-tRNA(Asn)/Glu-tRNA(Gln) amidotransferase subunit GatC [Patescibacteria group bacterium]